MNTYIILLRGVNVGGKNLLSMQELKVFLESTGLENVKTYIQSGNIVLRSEKNPEDNIATLIKTRFGVATEVLALTDKQLEISVSSNPYKQYEGKFVHFYFCKDTPQLNSAKLEKLNSETERYKVLGNVFYLHAPDGIGRSKLVANIEACLGVSTTGRNLNTVYKLKEMASNA